MEDKKLLYIAIAVIALMIVALIFFGVLIFRYFTFESNPAIPELPNVSIDPGQLPVLQNSGNNPGANANQAQSELAKEKQFISSFWQPLETPFTAQITAYEIPIKDIKETVTNYRDFSRKINVEPALDKLSANGFALVQNPFTASPKDWAGSFKLIKENGLPVLISADAVLGAYQDSLQVIYKEIEQDIFYPSLWELLEKMFFQAKNRYEVRFKQYGIESDVLTEANRLELAYLTVALNLLEPKSGQVRDSLSADQRYFSPQEGESYSMNIPDYLAGEVAAELDLINQARQTKESPIMLYQQNYQDFKIPTQYQTSEKLKNYFLTITWLNEVLFPLWHQENDCANCLLDRQDQAINFVAALLLSNDLASNQELKNRWANIYKSISFFRGLESNLTYLDYHQALQDTFGAEFQIDQLFNTSPETVKERIALLQETLAKYEFPAPLAGAGQAKETAGLKLLRDYHLLEDRLFNQLTFGPVGDFKASVKRGDPLPFSACSPIQDQYQRCWPSGLDLFNLLGNQTAKNILQQTQNDFYHNYQSQLDNFRSQLDDFDQNTWHDNAYMGLLAALKNLDSRVGDGWPAFMKNENWSGKTLYTSLGAWASFHYQINYGKTSAVESGGLVKNFSYGYLEPQLPTYDQLLANVKMISQGFSSLQIISPLDKTFERLKNLSLLLENVIAISQRELNNEKLTVDDYSFINNFDRHLATVTGDIDKKNLEKNYEVKINITANHQLLEKIDGISYLIVTYPDTEGKQFFAIGPVLNYTESNNKNAKLNDWQVNFNLLDR
ncbi:MAG: DUF3160 domain-containing protein [Patescibacteria group bacterium]|jgi:hypothetical protein|nr:DUF3160 domain-containing protein [Patescibacteria group bacterium]